MGTILSLAWDALSADNFAIPRAIWGLIKGALGSVGSAT